MTFPRTRLANFDLFIIALLVSFAILIANIKLVSPSRIPILNADQRRLLGAEHNSVAKALRSGRGYSDPFRTNSGPTAWVAPIWPTALATIYWLCDDKEQNVVEWSFTFNHCVVLCVFVLYVIQFRRDTLKIIAYFVLPIALVANFSELFQKTHDTALLLLLNTTLWTWTHRLVSTKTGFHQQSVGRKASWGLFGGVLTLASPILGFSWASCSVLTLAQLFRTDRKVNELNPQGGFLSGSLLVIACFAMVIAPWTLRNFRQFQHLVPIKSNASYELWQSQCSDADGVLDLSFIRTHPWSSHGVGERSNYTRLGETAFLRDKHDTVWEDILSNPSDYGRRVWNRFVAALLWYQPYSPTESKLMIVTKRFWILFPTVVILSQLLFRADHTAPWYLVSLTITLSCLAPYIAVSFYERYATPLLLPRLLFISYGLSFIFVPFVHSKHVCGSLSSEQIFLS